MKWLRRLPLWLVVCSSIEIAGICGLAILSWVGKGWNGKPSLIVLAIVFVLTLASAVASKVQKWISDRFRVKLQLVDDDWRVSIACNVNEEFASWLDSRRGVCMQPLRDLDREIQARREASAGGYQLVQLDAYEARIMGEAMESLANVQSQINEIWGSSPEDRTREAYIEEVEAYLKEADTALRGRFLVAYVQSGKGLLRPCLINSTDRTFKDVQLSIFLPTGVSAIDPLEIDEDISMPKEPRKYGTRVPSNVLRLGYGSLFLPPMASHVPTGPFVSIEKSSTGTRVEYPAVTLRAKGRADDFPEVHLLMLDEFATKTLNVKWEATADNAEGRVSGEFSIAVGPESVTPRDLLGEDLAGLSVEE